MKEIFSNVTLVLSILLTISARFLDYEKIIEMYASKYANRVLLVNPISGN